ncbi:MAG: hypothetical protein IT561_10680 [Alphaproteobacteria bacterium]|nr:hypothetical protein [Alphaproteobacteria bacterium]
MSAPAYDRARLVDTLARLAAEDEETVLEAARSAVAILADAGVGWETLLRGSSWTAAAPAGAAPAVDDAARIAALLTLPDLSSDARESLAEIAADLARAGARAEDRAYLVGLYERLIGGARDRDPMLGA